MKHSITLFAYCLTLLICHSCHSDFKDAGIIWPDTSKDRGSFSTLNTYSQLRKLSITGDFNGDGSPDTIQQNTFNLLTGISIDSFPNNAWDSIQLYFSKNDAGVILTISGTNADTLRIANAGALFCLINLGDINHDKNDEIALVADYFDFTNISTCFIYTLCKKQWVMLKSFKIHEDAFIYEKDMHPVFNQINGYLEKRGNQWIYIDYLDLFNAETPSDTILKPLLLKRGC